MAAPLPGYTPIKVATRWHQLVVILSIMVGAPGGIFAGMTLLPEESDILWTLLGIAGGFLLGAGVPITLLLLVAPFNDEVCLGPDRLTLRRRGEISFSSIRTFNTDDYIKLGRVSGPTLLLQMYSTRHAAAYKTFCAELVQALESWRQRQDTAGAAPQLKRTRFYGSPLAQSLGWLLVLTVVISVGFAFAYQIAIGKAIFLLCAGLPMGLSLALGGRPAMAKDVAPAHTEQTGKP